MAEINLQAKTNPVIGNGTELWYSEEEDGTGLKQIFQLQEIPQIDTLPEVVEHGNLEALIKFSTQGVQPNEPIEIPILYIEEQHKMFKEYQTNQTDLWFFVKLPDASAVTKGKPLTTKFRGTIAVAIDNIGQEDMLQETVQIYKNSIPEEIAGLPAGE